MFTVIEAPLGKLATKLNYTVKFIDNIPEKANFTNTCEKVSSLSIVHILQHLEKNDDIAEQHLRRFLYSPLQFSMRVSLCCACAVDFKL